MAKSLTIDQFVEKSESVHGKGTFDYSQVIYKNNKTPIILTCKRGHTFSQLPNNNLKGYGCRQCYDIEQKDDKESFIEKAQKVHKDYDYTNVVYKGTKEKVDLICPSGHNISITPSSFLQGQGCRECYIQSITKTTEDFITQSREVHGDLYDYSMVDYKKWNIKVEIGCPRGHSFFQKPSSHIAGFRCNICYNENNVGMKREYFEGKPTILYYVVFEEEVYKIGITSTSTKMRMRGIGKPYRIIKEILFEDGGLAYDLEQYYHQVKYRQFRYISDDYLKTGNNEIYYFDVMSLDQG